MRFADFFAGIGLASLGLVRAGWISAFANDNDSRKFEIYAANFVADPYIVRDIKEVRASDVPEIDLAWASFPCTDLSLAGERKGLDGHESGTLWEFLRVLREMQDVKKAPRLVVLENVVGFLTSKRGRDLRDAIAALNACGYLCDVVILDAVRFVPQSRPRLFAIGVRGKAAGVHQLDLEKDLVPSLLRPQAVVDSMRANSDLSWGAITIPDPPRNDRRLPEVLERIPPSSFMWWSAERTSRLLSQMSPRHLALINQAKARKTTKIMTVYRRVRPTGAMAEVRDDGIAGCLRTPRGGSSRQILVYAGRGIVRVRFMTPREYARLQGVPDEYKITVRDSQALFGFGDAVCVPAVEWLARNALNPLAHERLDEKRHPPRRQQVAVAAR
jgi:DNA (cytosine-5)-methyltransferase 1